MSQVICTRCGHANPITVDRCERCYKKLNEEKATASGEITKSPGTLIPSGKKAPPPTIGSSSLGHGSGKAIVAGGKGSVGSGGVLPTSSSPSGLSFPGSAPKPLRPLPSHMMRYGAPSLEGIVKDIREMQLDKPLSVGDIAGDAFLALFDYKLAIFSWINKMTRRDKYTAYAIQIEHAPGSIKGALIQGGKAIPPEIGEYVSIWGDEKKGVVMVRNLYNHITGAEI